MQPAEIINELASLTFNDKFVYSKTRTLKRVKEFNSENLMFYYENYHKPEFQPDNTEFNYSTFENYRSKIIDFIFYCQTESVDINHFTQKQLEEYFIKEQKSGTLGVRKASIEQFLRSLSIFLDFSKIAERIKALKEFEKNAHPLSSKEIERIRFYYRNDKFKLFIFEWLYSLNLTKDDFNDFNIKDFDCKNNAIILNGEEIKIPISLSDLIDSLRADDRFDKTRSVLTANIYKMETELHRDKIIEGPFRDMDIKETIKVRTYNVCPECGHKYENVADNWVVKQYEKTGAKWIVCKMKCGKADE